MNKGYKLRKQIEAAKRRKIYNHHRPMTEAERKQSININYRINNLDFQLHQIEQMVESCNRSEYCHIVLHCGGYQSQCNSQQSIAVLQEMSRVINIERQKLVHQLDTLTDAK